MKKWILYLSFFLPFFGWSEVLSNEKKLTLIEHEMKVLKERLKQIQTQEIEEEVKGQGLMIADWEAYAKELELIRKQENEEKKLRLKIQQLEEQKSNLINSQSQTK